MKSLIDIVAKLRSEEGCPWDRKQTHKSLVPFMLEEAWEAIDEINQGKYGEEFKDELGDLLFQVVLHSQIAKENGTFSIEDVVETISKKMIRRHPHVFADQEQSYSEQELREEWHRLKFEESDRKSVMDGISNGVPALMASNKIGQRAASIGFDWDAVDDVLAKIKEEVEEVENEMLENNSIPLEEEIGDLLFAVCNLARHYEINPEIALHKANEKFKIRFRQVEKAIVKAKISGHKLSLAEMERHWTLAKKSNGK